MRRGAFFVLACHLFAGAAHAAPQITSTSFSVSSGETIAISGFRFGGGPSTVLLWDDFEGGKVGTALAPKPKIGRWTLVRGSTLYSTADKHSGKQSAYCNRLSGGSWGNFEVGSIQDSPYWYGTFWFQYNCGNCDGQSKINQVHGSYYERTGRSNFSPGGGVGAGTSEFGYIALEDTDYFRQVWYRAPSQNTWHKFEFIGKQSGAKIADGRYTVLIDGVPLYDQNPVITRTSTSHHWSLFQFFTGITNNTGGSITYIDDAYLNTTWARIEIGDQPKYSRCTVREIQIPTAWSSTSVSATVNQGGFANGTTAYLFVVDAAGSPSNGVPITFRR